MPSATPRAAPSPAATPHGRLAAYTEGRGPVVMLIHGVAYGPLTLTTTARAVVDAGFDAALDGLRALAMPTVPCGAPLVEDAGRYITILSRAAIPWSLTGLPAISVPCGVTAGGLPIGLQLVAGRGREHLLVALASPVEQTLR